MTFSLSSPAFEEGTPIPERFDHEHGDVSPPLQWDCVPDGTVELVLLVDDPRAPVDGSFVHWVLFELSPLRTGLEEDEQPAEARHGSNGYGQPGYLGPAPPAGHGQHRYVFRLLALREPLSLDGRPTYTEVEDAASGLVIDEARLVGTVTR
jgi:Raf kinase inhibitor-like YbhB/YbcL family protein